MSAYALQPSPHHQIQGMRSEMESQRTKAGKNAYGTKWGMSIERSPLEAISPALDLTLSRPSDPAHSEYNGMTK